MQVPISQRRDLNESPLFYIKKSDLRGQHLVEKKEKQHLGQRLNYSPGEDEKSFEYVNVEASRSFEAA
jgi:hypothetical protein